MEGPICLLCDEVISILEIPKKLCECYKCHFKIHHICGMEARIFQISELKNNNIEWICPKCLNSSQLLNTFCFLCSEQHGILLDCYSKSCLIKKY